MHKTSLDSIEKAAKRIAAKHYFCNVETQENVDEIWAWTELDDEDAVFKYQHEEVMCVWHPFQEWDFIEVLDSMIELKDSIVREMTQELQ